MKQWTTSPAWRGLAAAWAVVWLAGCVTVSHTTERSRLVGSLWWVSAEEAARPVEEWRRDLDELQALGMELIVLNGPFVGRKPAPGEIDPMRAFFEEANRRGLRLYVDTLAVANWWTLDDPKDEIARARKRIDDVVACYGRYRSFEGWYIPYETYVSWDAQAKLVRDLYREVSAYCKRVTPNKPTMVSPFFILDKEGYLGDFRWAAPPEYQAFWTDVLKEASIDIVALQDSGEHLAFYTIEERAPFFGAMKAACDAAGATLWANVETGELNIRSYEDYVGRFGAKTHVNDPATTPFWHGVPAAKLRDKLRFTRQYTPTAITWGYREFIRPSLGPLALDLYLDYYMTLVKGKRPFGS